MLSCSLPSSRATSTTSGIMIGSNSAIATDSLTSACDKFHGNHTEGKREREREREREGERERESERETSERAQGKDKDND